MTRGTLLRRALAPALAATAAATALSVAVPASAHADTGLPGCTEAQQQAAGTLYLKAITDPAYAWRVPFAPHATRIENGSVTGSSGFGMQLQFALRLQYSVIDHLEGVTWVPTTSPSTVEVSYDTVTIVGVRAATTDVFTFDGQCRISRVDASFSVV